MSISAAKWLFYHPVGWLIPDYATYSDFYTNEEGMSLTGDAKTDEAIVSADKFVQLPTSHMAQLLGTGIKIALNDPNDAVVVYERIMEHLGDWVLYLSRPRMIAKEIPIEGLREFNNLARTVFNPANRHHYHVDSSREKNITLALDKLMSGNANAGRHSFNDKVMLAIEQRYREQHKATGGGNERSL